MCQKGKKSRKNAIQKRKKKNTGDAERRTTKGDAQIERVAHGSAAALRAFEPALIVRGPRPCACDTLPERLHLVCVFCSSLLAIFGNNLVLIRLGEIICLDTERMEPVFEH